MQSKFDNDNDKSAAAVMNVFICESFLEAFKSIILSSHNILFILFMAWTFT